MEKIIVNDKALPVSVSGCNPVYDKQNKKIISWYVVVDLKSNACPPVAKKYWPIVKKADVYFVGCKNDGVCLVDNYDSATNITTVKYDFRDGLFGRGAERAWQFRIKMLALINKNRNENIK